MTLDALISQHADDYEGLDLFTAYTAAAPFHRLGVSMLVQEASPVDPIDLFVLKGIRSGRTSPASLAEFFGLDEHDVDVSLAAMLHDTWIRADSSSEGIALGILPTGHKVLEEEVAYSQQVREAEVWLNATSGEVELKIPRRRLLQGKDARARNLFLLRDRLPKPQTSADLDFAELQSAVTKAGSAVWAGTKLTVVLDVLGVTPKPIGYREVDVLVFQSLDGRKVEFEVFDAGVRSTLMESGLRRLEEERAEVVPLVELPAAEDIEAFRRQATWVEAIRERETGSQDSALEQIDTRDRLRDQLSRAEGTIRVLQERQDLQQLARNGENREVWVDVLTRRAQRYVVMEFPWITRQALDDEIIGLMQAAMRRGVHLWLSWGLDEKGRADPGDPVVLEKLRVMERRRDPGKLTVRYRGDTHRKILLWDSDLALVGSFNFGSFRGDPRKPVRQEMCVYVTSPAAVLDLEAEFLALFGTETLSRAPEVS